MTVATPAVLDMSVGPFAELNQFELDLLLSNAPALDFDGSLEELENSFGSAIADLVVLSSHIGLDFYAALQLGLSMAGDDTLARARANATDLARHAGYLASRLNDGGVFTGITEVRDLSSKLQTGEVLDLDADELELLGRLKRLLAQPVAG